MVVHVKKVSIATTLLLAAFVHAAPYRLGKRQGTESAISIDGWSTVTDDGAAISVDGWTSNTDGVTDQVQSVELTLSNPSQTEIIQIFPVTVTDGGTTAVEFQTITAFAGPYTSLTDPDSSTTVGTTGHKNRAGAIAGGVIGAVLVASLLVLVLLRFKNKRSSMHWRNRTAQGRWDLDQKTAFTPSQPVYVANEPLNPPSPITPQFNAITPLVIRDRHRPEIADPFSDPHTSPGSPNKGHRRGSSGFGSFSAGHRRVESIEMSPSSPRDLMTFESKA